MKYASLVLASGALVVAGCNGSNDTANSGSATTSSPATSTTGGTAAAGGGYSAVQDALNANCISCHGATDPKHGVNLTSYDNVMKGDNEGPIVNAGDAAGSRLAKVIKPDGKPHMPPKGQLTDEQIKAVEDWIAAGAKNG
jgi:mono/diheme cytochrome c family protein